MEQSTVYNLHKLVFSLDRAADTLLQARFGISRNRAVVLVAALDQQDLTQHEIAVMLGRTDAAVSALLAELVKDGYVITRVSEHHKRRHAVVLTPKGNLLATEARHFLNGRLEELAHTAGVDLTTYNKQTEQLYTALTARSEK